MENLKLPAYPTFEIDGYGSSFHGILPNGDYAWSTNPGGFTKLELASLMAMQGILSGPEGHQYTPESVASSSASFAKAVLEQANK